MIGTNNTDGNPTLKKMLSNVPVGQKITITTVNIPKQPLNGAPIAMYKHSTRTVSFNINPFALKFSNIEKANALVHEVVHAFIDTEIDIAFPTNTNAGFQAGGGTYVSTTNPNLQARIRKYHAAYQTYGNFNFINTNLPHHNIIANQFLENLTKAMMEYTNTTSSSVSAPFRALAYGGLETSDKYKRITKDNIDLMKIQTRDLINLLSTQPRTGSLSDRCR